MTNQEIQDKINLADKIIRKLTQEIQSKKLWIDNEKEEVKEQYQDKEMIQKWSEDIAENGFMIEALEIAIEDLENELKTESVR